MKPEYLTISGERFEIASVRETYRGVRRVAVVETTVKEGPIKGDPGWAVWHASNGTALHVSGNYTLAPVPRGSRLAVTVEFDLDA